MAVDWLVIRNDYVNGLGNYRELSEKYGISQSTIRKRAAAEKWSDAKEEQRNKIGTKLEQETAKAIVKQEAKRAERLLSISDKLIDKIERAIAELDQAQVTNKTKTKVIEYKNGKRPDKPTKETITEKEEILAVASIVDRKGLQQVATALKAVWDVTGESETDKVGDQMRKARELLEGVDNVIG